VPGLVNPTLTTLFSTPSFRIYTYSSGETIKLLNYHQHTLDLVNSNKIEKPIWNLDYNFQDAYNLQDITGKSLKFLYEILTIDIDNVNTKQSKIHYKYSIEVNGNNNNNQSFLYCPQQLSKVCRLNHICTIGYDDEYLECTESIKTFLN
jgi:hypothetical protein